MAVGLLVGSTLEAQDAPKNKPAGEQGGASGSLGAKKFLPYYPLLSIDKMTELLYLTDEQKIKVKPMIEDWKKKYDENNRDTSLAEEDRRAKRIVMEHSLPAEIKDILTDEQLDEWRQIGLGSKKRSTLDPLLSVTGMAKLLDLTDEQKIKVKPIMEEWQKKVAELRKDISLIEEDRRTIGEWQKNVAEPRKDISLAEEDRRAKLKDLRKGVSAKLKNILTAEQLAKCEQGVRRPIAEGVNKARQEKDRQESDQRAKDRQN